MMKKRTLPILLGVLAALLLLASAYLFWRSAQGPQLPPDPTFLATPTPTPTPSPTISPTPTPSVEPEPEYVPTIPSILDDGLPHDKLFVTAERKAYESGDLQLLIPKLEVDVPILGGVDANTLLQGEGLYDYAQLPSENSANTSIAGHRNWIRGGKITLDQPFSYLDRLEEGDCIYLRDDTHIYQYVFEYQKVVESDDWSPIYKTDHTCVTLTTCTPIGVSDHRLILRGALYDVLDLDENYDYPAAIESLKKEAVAP